MPLYFTVIQNTHANIAGSLLPEIFFVFRSMHFEVGAGIERVIARKAVIPVIEWDALLMHAEALQGGMSVAQIMINGDLPKVHPIARRPLQLFCDLRAKAHVTLNEMLHSVIASR